MLDCSIVWDGPRCTWKDENGERNYILINESDGKVGEVLKLTGVQVYDLNEEARESGNPWRWFRFEEKEKAN